MTVIFPAYINTFLPLNKQKYPLSSKRLRLNIMQKIKVALYMNLDFTYTKEKMLPEYHLYHKIPPQV